MMGRMRFRTSYGQNQLQHSVEASRLAAMMAAELGADVAEVRRAAFLHDVGKVMTSDIEGPHHYIGADFARRLGETPEVCDAIRGHHDHDPEYQSVTAVLVQAPTRSRGHGRALVARAWRLRQATRSAGERGQLLRGRGEIVRDSGWPGSAHHRQTRPD